MRIEANINELIRIPSPSLCSNLVKFCWRKLTLFLEGMRAGPAATCDFVIKSIS